jgi:hypothetical protein
MVIDMSRISKVEFKLARHLSPNVRTANKLGENDFVEIRVENSIPSVHLEKISSPAKRVNAVLKRDGVQIKL